MLGNVEADLHLDDLSDFSNIADNLKKMRLFRHIEHSSQSHIVNEIRKSIQGKKLTPPMPDMWKFEHEGEYSDIYFGHDMYPNKMYYYHLVDKGQRPQVHILDEGMATYYKDIITVATNDFIDHRKYKNHKYIENVVEQMLFEPQYYCLKNTSWGITRIPPIDQQTEKLIFELYGKPEFSIFQEKYIYLAAGGYEDNYFQNEIDLLDYMSKVVGKENIIVKLHPRYSLDPFSKFGYKVLKNNPPIPWEAFLLQHDTSEQVFVTIFSTAVLSPKLLFGREQKIIFLYRLFQGTNRYGLFGRNISASLNYLKRIVEQLNTEVKNVFSPSSEEGFKETLRYIEGVRKGE